MAPLQPLMQDLGCSVTWDARASQATVAAGSGTIIFRLGSTVYFIDGQEKSMSVAPEIVRDRIFCPVRDVVQAVGASLTWDPETLTVSISSARPVSPTANLAAHQVMTKANKAAAAQNTFKFRKKRQIDVSNTMNYSWGKFYKSDEVSYEESDGCRQYEMPQQYESVKIGIPPAGGKSMVVEDHYEQVTSNNTIYVKAPTGVWVKTDQQTPAEFMKSMGKTEEDRDKDLVIWLTPDEKMENKDCQVISFQYKPEFFQPLIKNLVEQQLDVSEADPAISRSIWDQVGKNMKASGSGKIWIDKTTGLQLYEESKLTISFSAVIPVPDSGGHTMNYSYNMQDTIREERSNYGVPVVIPDVSKAISSEDYARINPSLLDTSIL